MKKLNLGCGYKKLTWYVNLDLLELDWVDVVHNMEEFPYPFDDNAFDEIFAEHNFEHINDLEHLMREIYRIWKNWALLKVEVPYYTCNSAFADPTHKRFFTYRTMNYFCNHFYFNDLNFELVDVRIHFFSNKWFLKSDWLNIIFDFLINLFPNIYERFFAWIFPSSEIHYLLRIKK